MGRGETGGGAYLDGLPDAERQLLERVNRVGIDLLADLLGSRKSIAFLGAGASAPLYPPWSGVIAEVVDGAGDRLSASAAVTCRALAEKGPDAVVEYVRQQLGVPSYHDVLRKVFSPRTDPVTKRSWTLVHELVARCSFAGVITTNYDPGIVNARMAVRPDAHATGFASWMDDWALDRWRTGDIFEDDDLPVLYAHGHHDRPESIVLAVSEYRSAYRGTLARVLGSAFDVQRLVWIGFSFADARIAAILREVDDSYGSVLTPGRDPRHVAIMPWERADGVPALDPEVMRSMIETRFGCRAVLYPVERNDHSALHRLLSQVADGGLHPPASPGGVATGATPSGVAAKRPSEPASEASPEPGDDPVVEWVHGGTPADYFAGRVEELGRLERWAADDGVRLIGVTAWGGAGKTELVTQWLAEGSALAKRQVRGLFGWSFYENQSADQWGRALLQWMSETYAVDVTQGSLPAQVLRALAEVPLILVLDGLEVIQEGPKGVRFGRLLDGTLRDVLTGLCQIEHGGFAVLTSRFPFADIDQFIGGAARMVDLAPLDSHEGAELLRRGGGEWVPEDQRVALAEAVDGHALAITALAGILSEKERDYDVQGLVAELRSEASTDDRVAHALQFYARRLDERDRSLVAVVSLFQRPVESAVVLRLGTHDALGAPLAGWTVDDVEAAVRQRLDGLLTWHQDATVSAHPLVRDSFRSLILSGETAQLASDVTLADLPRGVVADRTQTLQVVEMIELLIAAGDWVAADALFVARTDTGEVFKHLPAARLGQRCANAFVATPALQATCRANLPPRDLAFYLKFAGMSSASAGDLDNAIRLLEAATEENRSGGEAFEVSITLGCVAECHADLGNTELCHKAAVEASSFAESSENPKWVRRSHGRLGYAKALAGDSIGADEHFATSNAMSLAAEDVNIYSLLGYWWGLFLIATGRVTAARRVAVEARAIAARHGWNEDLARGDHLIAICDLTAGNPADAGSRLDSAALTFRQGDYAAELARVLSDVAEHRRRVGQLDEAERLCAEAISLAGPRRLVPAHAAALSVRARVGGDRFTATKDRDHLDRARDDLDQGLQLATRASRLPWSELAALEAGAWLDEREGVGHGWAGRAADLRTVLVPEALKADPLADPRS